MRRAALVIVATTLLATLMPLGGAAQAAPTIRGFGPLVEDYARYQGQSTCSPRAKPGMLSFKSLLLRTYGSTWIGIGRACHIGGRSEHKEGRALDWSMDATKRADRRKVNDLMSWLFATDGYGNPHARARRLGIMYVIWNRRWWTSWNRRWETYCVQKRRGCVSPRDGGLNHPHADHVHFSFSWAAARKRTSFFEKPRSWVMGMATDADGYWLAGGDGSVNGFRAPYLGSRAGTYPRNYFVGLASTPSGGGYWLMTRSGRVFRFGDAHDYGRVTMKAVDIEATPSGNGYWTLSRGGRVAPFGDAGAFGRPTLQGEMAALAATPSGNGYWVFGRDGRVHAFGDALHHGDLSGGSLSAPVVDAAALGDSGYWLLLKNGKVEAFGSAVHNGNASSVAGLAPARAIVASSSGNGYWVAGRRGKVAAFGDATVLGSLA